MGKKTIIVVWLVGLALASIDLAEAQQPKKVARIGFLTSSTASFNLPRFNAFREGLHDLGYVEGQNITIEYRFAEGKLGRLPDLAVELVRLKVDLIIATADAAVRAAKQASKTIPIVFVGVSDPVGEGFVTSLAQPGGNTTGLSILQAELSGKRLELLKEAFPQISRLAILFPSGSEKSMNEQKLAAQVLALGPIGRKRSVSPSLHCRDSQHHAKTPWEYKLPNPFQRACQRAGGSELTPGKLTVP